MEVIPQTMYAMRADGTGEVVWKNKPEFTFPP